WYAKRFLHPEIVVADDYVFIWDEDLGVKHFNGDMLQFPNMFLLESGKCCSVADRLQRVGMGWAGHWAWKTEPVQACKLDELQELSNLLQGNFQQSFCPAFLLKKLKHDIGSVVHVVHGFVSADFYLSTRRFDCQSFRSTGFLIPIITIDETKIDKANIQKKKEEEKVYYIFVPRFILALKVLCAKAQDGALGGNVSRRVAIPITAKVTSKLEEQIKDLTNQLEQENQARVCFLNITSIKLFSVYFLLLQGIYIYLIYS
ncbi:hypothetical protein M8C21_019846, partial [Ambrosia artemisiifolia]